MHKKVSLIVPVYNVSDYLDRFIDSVLGQSMSGSEFEVILVDDGSTDDSGNKIDYYADAYDFITAYHQENKGPAAARNRGIDEAVGEYMAFVDPDDLLEHRYLETAYNHAFNNGADIVIFDAYRDRYEGDHLKREMWGHADYGFCTSFTEYKQSMQRQIIYPYMAARVADMSFHRNVPLAAPWDKLYKRSFLEANNLRFCEDLRVLDDMCFNFRAFGAAGRVTYIPAFQYHYTVINTSVTNSYRSDRLVQDIKVFQYLKDEIDAMDIDRAETARFMQALYARIIKSFAISMRLYFFNPKNPKTENEINEELKGYIDTMPYKQAFKGIHLYNLEPKLVAVTLACRLKMVWALRVMYRMQYGSYHEIMKK